MKRKKKNLKRKALLRKSLRSFKERTGITLQEEDKVEKPYSPHCAIGYKALTNVVTHQNRFIGVDMARKPFVFDDDIDSEEYSESEFTEEEIQERIKAVKEKKKMDKMPDMTADIEEMGKPDEYTHKYDQFINLRKHKDEQINEYDRKQKADHINVDDLVIEDAPEGHMKKINVQEAIHKIIFGDMSKADMKIVKHQEKQYPDMTKEFFDELLDSYVLFCLKNYNYGPDNIKSGADVTKVEGMKFALKGIWFRLNDKMSRFKTLVFDERDDVVGESLKDTLTDICNYATISKVLIEGKWGK